MATVDGRLTATITPKFALDFDGFGTIASIPTSEAHAHADIDGYFAVSAAAKFDLDAVSGKGQFDGWFDTSKGTFGGKIDSTVTLGTAPIDVDVGFAAYISNEMISGCYKPLGGFAYYFKTRDVDVSVGSCPGEPPVPAWVADAAQAEHPAAGEGRGRGAAELHAPREPAQRVGPGDGLQRRPGTGADLARGRTRDGHPDRRRRSEQRSRRLRQEREDHLHRPAQPPGRRVEGRGGRPEHRGRRWTWRASWRSPP